jgi:hypothetical protein
LGERLQRENGEGGIDLADGAAKQIGGGGFSAGGERPEADEERNIALESARERNVDLPGRIFLEKLLRCRGDDTDDFDGFLGGRGATKVGVSSDPRPAALGAGRVVARVLNALTECIAVRPKFFREDVVNDGNHGPS